MRRSHAGGYRAAWTVYLDLYPRGGHYTTVKAFQVYLREGNRHVRVAQLCFPSKSHAVFRYAYFKKLDYFSTECIYSPDAYRGHARTFLKDLEAARPSAIIDIIHSGEAFEVSEEVKATQKLQRWWPPLNNTRAFINFLSYPETCKRCGYMSSNELCKACTLLEGLERGMASSGIVSPAALSCF